MRKAGGIIAIIAGVLGLIAAAVTFMFGGLVTLFSAALGIGVIGMSAFGALASFLLIIFGSVAINAHDASPGAFIIATSILGGIFGGGFVGSAMVLALIGGIFACIGPEEANDEVVNTNPMSDRQRLAVVIVVALVFLSGIFYLSSTTKNSVEEGESLAQENIEQAPIDNALPNHSYVEPSDGTTPLTEEIAPPELQAKEEGARVQTSDLQHHMSKTSIDMLNDEAINPIAKKLLGQSYDEFISAIAVSASKGIEMEGDYYIGIGCSVQGCKHKAGFAIGKDSHEMFAVIVDGEATKTFGVSSYFNLPEILRQRIEHQANAETTSM